MIRIAALIGILALAIHAGLGPILLLAAVIATTFYLGRHLHPQVTVFRCHGCGKRYNNPITHVHTVRRTVGARP